MKRKLADGQVALGTMAFEFATSGLARIAAAAGAEFVLYDMEHTGWSVETIRHLMAWSRSASIVPLVRVPAGDYHFISRVLDVGAMGIMVPMVSSADQARNIVEYARYPPMGCRGAAFGVAHDDYHAGDFVARMQTANEEVLLIALIETAEGVESVEAIAAVEGIDVLWIGHYDLTNSMGIPGQFEHPRFLEAVDRVVKAGVEYKKSVGFMAASVEEGVRRMQQGFRCLAFSGDIWIYQKALQKGLAGLRAAIMAEPHTATRREG